MVESDFELPLTNEHLRAIGRITAQWALLEALIDLLVFGREHHPNATVEPVPEAMSFTQRMRLWEMLAAQRLTGSDLERMRTLIRKAADIFTSLDTMSHHRRWGLTTWLAEQLRLVNHRNVEASSDIPDVPSVESLEGAAQEIATINEELLACCRRLGGKLFPAA